MEGNMTIVSKLAQLMRDLKDVQLISGCEDSVNISWGVVYSDFEYETMIKKNKGFNCIFSFNIVYTDNDAYDLHAPYIINAFMEEFHDFNVQTDYLEETHASGETFYSLLIVVR